MISQMARGRLPAAGKAAAGRRSASTRANPSNRNAAIDSTVKKMFSGVMAFVSTVPRYPLRPDGGSDPPPVVSWVVSSVTAAQVLSRRPARAGRSLALAPAPGGGGGGGGGAPGPGFGGAGPGG